MNNQLCKDNVICCDDNCQRCANLIYNKYIELQEENKRLKQEYEPLRHGEWRETRYIEVKRCSCCNAPINILKEAHIYCSTCGAKMDEGNNNAY